MLIKKKEILLDILYLFIGFGLIFPFKLKFYGIHILCIIFVSLLLYLLIQCGKIGVGKSIFKTFILFTIELFLALLSSCVNANFDIYFLKHFMMSVLLFLNIFTFDHILKNKTNMAKINIGNFFATISFLQCLIIILRYTNQEFASILEKIFYMTDFEILNVTDGFRLVGIGCQYFGGGVTCSYLLVLIAYFIIKPDVKDKKWLIFNWLLLSFVSVLVARTALIGCFFSLVMFLLDVCQSKKHFIYLLFSMLIFVIGILFMFNNLENFTDNSIQVRLFKMFLNPSKEFSFYSGIGNSGKKTMWKFPQNYKTWLIGDAKLNNRDGSYYMSTDFGYCRRFFYFGLFGTLTEMILIIFILYYYTRYLIQYRNLMFFVFTLIALLVNIKGIAVPITIPMMLGILYKNYKSN